MAITKELYENYMRNRLVEMSKDTASNIVAIFDDRLDDVSESELKTIIPYYLIDKDDNEKLNAVCDIFQQAHDRLNLKYMPLSSFSLDGIKRAWYQLHQNYCTIHVQTAVGVSLSRKRQLPMISWVETEPIVFYYDNPAIISCETVKNVPLQTYATPENITTVANSPVLSFLADNKFYAIKDYITESSKIPTLTPLNWNDLLMAESLKDIKQRKWRRMKNLGFNIDKLPLQACYLLLKSRPHVTNQFFSRMVQTVQSLYKTACKQHQFDAFNWLVDCKGVSKYKEFLTHYIMLQSPDIQEPWKPERQNYHYHNERVIKDLINMNHTLKQRLDLHAFTVKAIDKHHDLLVDTINKKEAAKRDADGPFPVDIYKPFYDVIDKYPGFSEFKILTLPSQLYEEGKRQHNCVASYTDYCYSETSLIMTCDYKDEHVTVEINMNDQYQYYIGQCYAACNAHCSDDIYNLVQNLVDFVNTYL